MIALDTSFGIDHYTFSDLTINNGKHRNVTTPVQAVTPTSVADAKLFGFQPTTNYPVIQYSVAQSAPFPAPPYVASPVTYLQSPAAPQSILSGGTLNVLDFSGSPNAYGFIYGIRYITAAGPVYTSFFTYSTFRWFSAPANQLLVTNIAQSVATFSTFVTGNILQLKNTSPGNFADVFWTVQLWRTQ